MIHEFEQWIRTPGAPKQAVDAQHNYERDRHLPRYMRQVQHFLNRGAGRASSRRPPGVARGEVDAAELSGGGGGGGFAAVGHPGMRPGDGAPGVFGDNPHGHVMGRPDDRVERVFEGRGIGERQGARGSGGRSRRERGGRGDGDARGRRRDSGGGDGGKEEESGSSHDQVCVYFCVCVFDQFGRVLWVYTVCRLPCLTFCFVVLFGWVGGL